MPKKSVIITVSVLVGLVVAAGLGVLIWWLVRDVPESAPDEPVAPIEEPYETIKLEGDGIGDAAFTAAFTRVAGRGDMFWWFYPSHAENATSKTTLVWLHGITGEPPSFLANFGGIGPYDTDLNKRENSWLKDYNILFVDAPIGTGFSTYNGSSSDIPDLKENVNLLEYTLQSFYDLHEEYKDTPVYFVSLGDGAQLAIPLALNILRNENSTVNVKGLVLGNPIVSPALALTKLGFYLEELAYIDGNGRTAIETFAVGLKTLVDFGQYSAAFSLFETLGDYVNDFAGAVAVNMRHIVEKLTQSSSRDYFGGNDYLRSRFPNIDQHEFMTNTIAPALGLPTNVKYDGAREDAVASFRNLYMSPIVDQVELLLENTDVQIIIFNGNLDAVSNTPGQLEWITSLNWTGQENFLNQPRGTLAINSLIKGYSRISDRLQFYWINVAGHWVQIDNPVAMKELLDRAISN